MKLPHRPRAPNSQWDILQNPSLTNPIRHERCNGQGSWDRSAFEILGFSGSIFGHVGDCDIEAREASQSAEDEESEEEVVDWGAETDCEGCCGGGEAE